MTPRYLLRLFQILLGVFVGLALAYLFLRPPETGEADGPESYFLQSPLPAPDFALTSHRGERVTLAGFPARLRVVFFGYTSCPDVCPLTLSNLSRAFGEMGEEGDRIQVLLVTVDPGRDTPERLARYLGSFHPSFLGLTGTEEEIRAVADAFGVFFARVGEGDGYTVDHTARTFVIDASGTIPLTFPVTAAPGEMARDLTLLLERQP